MFKPHIIKHKYIYMNELVYLKTTDIAEASLMYNVNNKRI